MFQIAIVIGCVVYIKCFRKKPPAKPKIISKREIGAPNVYGDNPHITHIPNNMPAPRGFVKSDHPMPPPRVQNVKETSMNAYINDSFQSETVGGMSSDDYYDEICIGQRFVQRLDRDLHWTRFANEAVQYIIDRPSGYTASPFYCRLINTPLKIHFD